MVILISSLVLALLAVSAAVILAMGNPGIITVHFLSWSFNSSLTPLLLAAFILGLSLGWLITIPTSIRKSFTIAGQKRKTKKLKEQLPPNEE
jgi:uncharacterized membrane protein YciS (DUF1049 family)